MSPGAFSLAELHAALDAAREARGLSWAQMAREMRVSAATVAALRTRATAEADGVLQMLRWLGRPLESLAGDHSVPDGAFLEVAARQMARFDTAKLHAALEARRIERGMTWTAVAEELGVAATSLTRLADGGRTAFPQVLRMTRWLGRPAAEFIRATNR